MGQVGVKFMSTEAQHCRAIPLGLAAEIEMFFRRELTPLAVDPGLTAQKFAVRHHAPDVERAAVGRERRALFEHQHAPACADEAMRRRRAAGAGTDHDCIVDSVHGDLSALARVSGERVGVRGGS